MTLLCDPFEKFCMLEKERSNVSSTLIPIYQTPRKHPVHQSLLV